MSETRYYVGLDVGGTTMKAGVVDDEGRPLGPAVSMNTDAHLGQDHGLEVMCETIRRAIQAANLTTDQIVAIGVATPGPMDLEAGLILDSPNLPHWFNVPVRDHISRTFDHKPTAFQNDANAATYGEFWAGAGRKARSMVMFTLGTGVGGGIIIGDTLVEGNHSHGGELGHIKIEMTNPRLCGCGRYGCLEAYASGTGVVATAREVLFRCGSYNSSLGRFGINPHERLTARMVFEAAKQGDALAQEVVERTAYYLAIGASNLMHTIDPDMVVYGGGMIRAGDILLDRIRWYVVQVSFPVPAEKTEIRYAELGEDAGFIGAAGCARLMLRTLPQ